jgi:hypothetical protein
MNIDLFLQSVLPTQGLRFVVSIKNKLAVPRRLTSNQQVMDTAQQFDAQGFDVYFAVGGFMDGVNAKGQPSREAEYAQWHRCLRVDIDVQAPGENKPNKYDTKQAALQGLVDFINALHLPTPIVIDSGGGYHVYWLFDRDITRDVWQPMADRLKAAGVMHGLRADPTATADAARILRMPGTHNFKAHFGTNGVLVDCANPTAALTPMDPAQFDALLPQVQQLQAAGVAVAQPRGSAPQVAGSELSANVGTHTPYDIGSVIRECGVMTDMLAKQGDGYHNQQWYLMLNAVQASMHTDKQKRDIALVLSQGWKDGGKSFSVADFDNTFARARNGHPFSCATMANSGEPAGSICKACPYYADALPSVGRLGYNGFVSKRNPPQQQAAAAYTNGQPLHQGCFLRHPNGRIEIVDGALTKHLIVDKNRPMIWDSKAKTPGFKPVFGYNSTYTLKEVTRSSAKKTGNTTLVFTRSTDNDVAITLTNGQWQNTVVAGEALNDNDIYVGLLEVNDFKVFMKTFLQELQKLQKASLSITQCGWTDHETEFVWGLNIFNRNGTVTAAKDATDARIKDYHTEGDEALWRQGFNIVLNSSPDRQLLLALSIASPLMRFSEQKAVLVNMVGASEYGKTSTTDAVQSVWGSPDKLRLGLQDTENATYQIAGVTGSLPLILDENTIATGEDLLRQVHTLTQGRQKHRMDSKAQVISPDQFWNLIAFTSSNTSVISRLITHNNTDTGGPARVFEVALTPTDKTNSEFSSNKPYVGGLNRNFGWLAEPICRELMSRPAADWRRDVAALIAQWDVRFGLNGGIRFHSIVGALAEIGAAIGIKLGFNFNVAAIRQEVMKHWLAQQSLINSMRRSPIDFVRDYYIEKGEDCMVYVGLDKGRRVSVAPGMRPCAGELHPSANLFVVREKDLQQYVVDRKGDWVTVKHAIEADKTGTFIARNKRRFLDNSAHQTPAIAVCYEFSMSTLSGALYAVPTPATVVPTTQVQP